jgi:hypothetical protein
MLLHCYAVTLPMLYQVKKKNTWIFEEPCSRLLVAGHHISVLVRSSCVYCPPTFQFLLVLVVWRTVQPCAEI